MTSKYDRKPWAVRAHLAQLRGLPHRCTVCDAPPDELYIMFSPTVEGFVCTAICHGRITVVGLNRQALLDGEIEPLAEWFNGSYAERDAKTGEVICAGMGYAR